MSQEPDIRLLQQHVFSRPDTNVFTVLDGASVPKLPQALWKHQPEHVCLYRGELEPDLAETAPYLVRLEEKSPFTGWVFKEGWGNHWGVFAITPADVNLRMLRQHFRKFLMVYDPEGKLLYFRYYDPRVLRTYLPTCNAEELDIVFGPIDAYVLEGEDSSVLLRLSRDRGNIRMEEIPLAEKQGVSG